MRPGRAPEPGSPQLKLGLVASEALLDPGPRFPPTAGEPAPGEGQLPALQAGLPLDSVLSLFLSLSVSLCPSVSFCFCPSVPLSLAPQALEQEDIARPKGVVTVGPPRVGAGPSPLAPVLFL